MKFYELELENETIELRMTTTNAKALENKTGRSIFDLVSDMSVTNISKMLMYLMKGKKENVNEKEADELVDKLVDNGYTYERIMMEVIFEALVVSGFLSKEQLEEAKTMKEEVKEKNKEKILEDLQK
jgi:Na+/melibiose symporter-like transporter